MYRDQIKLSSEQGLSKAGLGGGTENLESMSLTPRNILSPFPHD